LLCKLGTCFTVPEEEIIKQGQLGNGLYYITVGDCIVNVVDQNNVELQNIRLLVEGDHFGEIALLYNCERTCTVISRNYNTMARLEYKSLRLLINEYPGYKKSMIKSILKYDDPKI
jgi:ATP-binding cassette, subfamily B, bacterial